ncbi:hypothetical protein [Desulfobacula sp.]|uniref:hypothetical protein n=1 Tax=Desulfobacula sp. TaxID=2593537 RepID=UPI0026075FE5|nr:hypothetical protein [Desulfobacula sp.]
MKKIKILIISGVLVLAINGIAFSGDTHSGKAIEQAGKAGSHGSASAAHAIVGSGQVTSAASAVPLSVAGSVGAVSTEVANELMDAATAPIGTPLEITDESVTAGPPPNEVLKTNKKTDL